MPQSISGHGFGTIFSFIVIGMLVLSDLVRQKSPVKSKGIHLHTAISYRYVPYKYLVRTILHFIRQVVNLYCQSYQVTPMDFYNHSNYNNLRDSDF